MLGSCKRVSRCEAANVVADDYDVEAEGGAAPTRGECLQHERFFGLVWCCGSVRAKAKAGSPS